MVRKKEERLRGGGRDGGGREGGGRGEGVFSCNMEQKGSSSPFFFFFRFSEGKETVEEQGIAIEERNPQQDSPVLCRRNLEIIISFHHQPSQVVLPL